MATAKTQKQTNTNTNLVKFETAKGDMVSFTGDDVRRLICPEASDKDIALFLAMCQSKHLDPIGSKDAYLVGYKDKRTGEYKPSMITSYHVFNRVACASPDYDGIESGVIVKTDRGVEQLTGNAWWAEAGQQLLGGWATVYMKNRTHPVKVTVKLSDYNTQRSSWAKMPGMMIEKVAKSMAWRTAFPDDLSGLYEASEMSQAQPIEAEVEPAPEAPTSAPAAKGVELTQAERDELAVIAEGMATTCNLELNAAKALILEHIGHPKEAESAEAYIAAARDYANGFITAHSPETAPVEVVETVVEEPAIVQEHGEVITF